MDEYGLVYGLTNPYFDGLVKIGVTRNLDITKRMRVLGTAVPKPFVCAFAYKVPLDSLFSIERTLHDTFADKRLPGSEFFAINPAKADNLLRTLWKYKPMQSEVQQQIDFDEATRTKKPNMDFLKMGLRIGQVLLYARNKSVQCFVASNKKVNYQGNEVSLSSITRNLLGYAAQPSPHWVTEDGTTLTQLYIASLKRDADKVSEMQTLVAQKANECHTL